MTKHCNIHEKDYTSASGCWYCRDEYKKALDINQLVYVTKLCSCGTRTSIMIRKKEEKGTGNCSWCNKEVNVYRY